MLCVAAYAQGCTIAALAPGISEELVFRVLLLPHPAVPADRFHVQGLHRPFAYARRAALPLLAFVLMHLINPHARSRAAFWDLRFLAMSAALGGACTAAYRVSHGSLWAAALVHWLPVCVWLFAFGGYQKLHD